MPVLSFVNGAIKLLRQYSLVLSGIAVVVLMFVGSIDIVSSRLFGQAIHSAQEIQECFEAILIFCALGAVQYRRAHIVIDLVTSHLGQKARRISDIFSLSTTAVLFALLSWQAYVLAARSVRFGELSPGFLSFPVYPFKCLFFLGCLIALLETLRQVVVLIFQRPDQVGEHVPTSHF